MSTLLNRASQRWAKWLFASLAVLLMTGASRPSMALDPPHDASHLPQVCDSCHTLHASYGTLLDPNVGASIENLCGSCHYAGGPGRDASVHACAGAGCKAQFSVTCTVCHDPHTQRQNIANGSTYGKFVRTAIATPNSGSRAVIFKGNQGAKSFADGDAVIDGVCEVCHTQTHYHANNGAHPASHVFAGLARCTNCHSHTGHFLPRGQCATCHSDRTAGTSMRLSGQHRKHVVEQGFSCSQCHSCVVNAQNGIIDGARHTNGQTDLCGPFTWNASTRGCSNVACHGSETWSSRALTPCTLCHGDTSDGRLPNRHSTHLSQGITCAECHTPVVTSNSAIADLGLHMNGTVTVKSGYNWNPTSRNCSNFACHGKMHQNYSW